MKKGVVVYVHGLHGSYKEIEKYSYLSDRYDLVGLDYPDSNPWEPKDIIRNNFKKITENYEEIIVISKSIGAFYTYEYLSDFPNIVKAFFISPVASMYQIALGILKHNNISEERLKEERYITLDDGQTISHEYNQYLLNYHDNWTVPTEILYGSGDKLIKLDTVIEFLKNHPLAKLTIKKDAEHSFRSPEELQFVKEWILRNI